MKGFSLLELLVVVVLLSLIVAITIPALGVFTGADSKSEILRLSGLALETFNRAALSGKTHRLIIDFENNQFYVQEKTLDASTFLPELGYELDIEEDKKADKDTNENKEYKPQFKNADGDLGEKMSLKSSLKFFSVWTEGLDEPITEGLAAIYFFPQGFAQSSFISLSQKDATQAQIYLSISPLTGEVFTGNGEPKIEDILNEGL